MYSDNLTSSTYTRVSYAKTRLYLHLICITSTVMRLIACNCGFYFPIKTLEALTESKQMSNICPCLKYQEKQRYFNLNPIYSFTTCSIIHWCSFSILTFILISLTLWHCQRIILFKNYFFFVIIGVFNVSDW